MFYRVLGWLGPIACITLAAFIIVNRQAALEQADRDAKKAQIDLESATIQRTKVMAEPQERAYAAAPATSLEERDFLDYLRQLSGSTGSTIMGWTANTATFGEREKSSLANVPFTDEEAKAIKGITRITCDLKVAGEYQTLRAFIDRVTTADRLVTLNRVTWTRDKTGCVLNVSISRYITAPQPPAGGAPTTQQTSVGTS